MGMQGKIERPNIFAFHSDALFLKEWLAYLITQPGVSLRSIARQSGIASGSLPMFLAGKRPLSYKTYQKIIPYLALKADERKYLDHLRTIALAESAEERLEALGRAQKMARYKSGHPKEIEVYKYLSKWIYVAIREMSFLKGFQLDPRWIQARLEYKFGLSEIEEAISFLKEKGFIELLSDGRVRVGEKNLDCQDGVFKVSLGAFHRQMFDLAGEAIDKTPRARREIGGETVAIRAGDFESVREILSEALNRIERLGAAASTADEVYHVSVAAFPLASAEKLSEEKNHEKNS